MKCENINHAAHKNDFKMQEISLHISEARKKYTLEKWFIFSRFALDANTRLFSIMSTQTQVLCSSHDRSTSRIENAN